MQEEARTLPGDAPTVLGVLGGVASGKSEVARLLAGEGGVVLSADVWAHEALDSQEVQARLLDAFGPQAVQSDGRTNREFLGERVFNDPEARLRLEGWIHPLVRARISAAFDEARSADR